MSSQSAVTLTAEQARAFTEKLLLANGATADVAQLVARCLVAADLRNVESHGINRIPSYMARARAGVLDLRAVPQVSEITPAVAQVDGGNGFGFVAASVGMRKACEMASNIGIGMVSVKHSNHFGMSAWIAQQAADAGMMSLVFTNSSPAMPPWGGRSPLLGVSPICCGAPGGPSMGQPFILDMAPSVVARGKVHKALRREEQIPEGWALDKDGHPTTDPRDALGGVMLPMGGAKGSGLAIMMDVFSGVLSGSAFAGHVTNPYSQQPSDVGHFLVAIKPNLFMSLDEFRSRMDYLYRRVTESDKAAGTDRIYFPGEIERLMERERLVNGIPFHVNDIKALNEEAGRVNVEQIGVQ